MALIAQEDVLNFLDLMDLDEEVIDQRLKSLMVRKTLSKKQLLNSLHLLQYKLLINSQENTECDNTKEIDFIAKLLTEVSEENIDYVCKITNIVLRLTPSSLASKAEHLLQQILSDLQLLTDSLKSNENQHLEEAAMLKLKVCDCILDAALHANKKLVIFLENPIEDMLNTGDDKVKSHFLTNTVPRLFSVVSCEYDSASQGMSILDRIWNYIQKLTEDKNHLALEVLVTLSEFYLPAADEDGDLKYESEIMCFNQFWQIILFGMNVDPASRKIAIYLAKRAIECFVNNKRNARITSEKGLLIFQWDISKEIKLKSMWDSYFVLIESLEEKQGNIVLPSLQLFDTVQSLGLDWLNIAYSIGLNHPNMQVKQKCIEYRMKAKLNNVHEAKALLEALNDINLYAKPLDIDNITANIERMFQEDTCAIIHIFKAFSLINWSPVPLYYVSKFLTKNMNGQSHAEALSLIDTVGTVCDILKISCNNVLIRKKVHTEFLMLLTECCDFVTKEQFLQIMSVLQTDFQHEDAVDYYRIIAKWLKNTDTDKKHDILECISENFYHLNVILATMNEEAQANLVQEAGKKFENINNVINRQYCDKLESFNVAAYLMLLYNYTTECSELKCIREFIEVNVHTITRYILELLLSNNVPSDYEITFLDTNLYPVLEKASKVENSILVIQHIIKTSLTILKDENVGLDRKIFSMTVLKVCMNAYKEENVQITDLLNATKWTEINKNETDKSTWSRLLNKFYQTLCEMVHLLTSKKVNIIAKTENEMIAFIDEAIECGDYGCLQWVLKLMRQILPTLNVKLKNYDIRQFIDRMWKEIEELKSNQQYTICIEEFINMLFELMQNMTISDNILYAVIIHYCKKIIEMGEVSVKPLLILARKMSTIPMTPEVGAVYILHEILLFSPVPRKDQRITNAATLEIISTLPNWESYIHDFDSPQHIAASILLNITDKEVLKTVFERMVDKIDLLFKNKQRYHGNSQHHRVLLAFLQHTLFVLLLQPEIIDLSMIRWCVDMLRKIPHQPSIKAYLEWIIALYFCLKQLDLNEANMDKLELKSVPQLSQFMIPFLVLKHRIEYGSYKMEEYTYVMEYLLSYTMGQQYSIRLHAQYLASQLHLNKTDTYDYIMKLIHKNFKESETEKNYIRLKEDFFVNRFDIVHYLTPKFIYHFVSIELGDETSNMQIFSVPKVAKCEAYIKDNAVESKVTEIWFCVPKNDYDIEELFKGVERERIKSKEEGRGDSDNVDAFSAIQKKYIPWRNMTDIDGFEGKKKTENTSGLIVVASLIDKLPNLGGLARTSEVFGVQTYVIDSLRHVQDRQFQGLSLSAERWVNIEEVRPGKPLKAYLLNKKSEGYSIVAAEQTSGSVPLQSFKFPKKTLLLLGHEKEGVPSDLLLLTDRFVEVPQQGFVRSLNVHVTAALFVWEYTRQHTLKN